MSLEPKQYCCNSAESLVATTIAITIAVAIVIIVIVIIIVLNYAKIDARIRPSSPSQITALS